MEKTTKEQVFTAADELLSEGVKPSQQLIRERIGRGSATTIHRALNEWWIDVGERLSRVGSAQTNVPMPVQKALDDLWRVASKQASVQQKSHEEVLLKRISGERSELAEEKQLFTQRLEKLSEQLAKAYTRIDTLQNNLDNQREANLQLEKQLYVSSTDLKNSINENKVLEKVIKELDKKLTKEK